MARLHLYAIPSSGRLTLDYVSYQVCGVCAVEQWSTAMQPQYTHLAGICSGRQRPGDRLLKNGQRHGLHPCGTNEDFGVVSSAEDADMETFAGWLVRVPACQLRLATAAGAAPRRDPSSPATPAGAAARAQEDTAAVQHVSGRSLTDNDAPACLDCVACRTSAGATASRVLCCSTTRWGSVVISLTYGGGSRNTTGSLPCCASSRMALPQVQLNL